jgi:hypothetical protein
MRFFKKCSHYSKHLLRNKNYHVTKNAMTSVVVFVTNVSTTKLPSEIENDDAYLKSVIDLVVLVSKKYQYLGIELMDIIIIVIIVGIVKSKNNNAN